MVAAYCVASPGVRNVDARGLYEAYKQITITLSALLQLSSHSISFAEECNYNWILANTDGSKTTKEQYAEKDRRKSDCKKRMADQTQKASNARQRLNNEFKIDPSGMTDGEAIASLTEEQNNRRQEKEEAESLPTRDCQLKPYETD